MDGRRGHSFSGIAAISEQLAFDLKSKRFQTECNQCTELRDFISDNQINSN